MKPYDCKGRSAIGILMLLAGIAFAAGGEQAETPPATIAGSPAFTLPQLPYQHEALEPYISSRTMSFHYSKHHQAYLDNLNKLVPGTEFAGLSLEEIIRKTADARDNSPIFNNAAQVWNHTFFWQSMKAGGGGKPTGKMLAMIEESFGSFDAFKDAFTAAAVAKFGSGWVWLVQDGKQLKIETTSNADTPIAHGRIALLTCDLWEHAYYLDYQNCRKDFVQAFLEHLVYWDVVASRLNLQAL